VSKSVALCRMSRRRFAKHAVAAGLSVAMAKAQRGPARVLVDGRRTKAELDRRLLGSFLEHLGRAVYQGVYEPGSALADEKGFRKDVLAEMRELKVPVIRYPGGNFVSGYNWLDGVGPSKHRPRVLERAWNSIETNQFGTNEFVEWCRAVGTEPLLATNLGTGTPESSAALVEYCNIEKGTKWSDLRQSHGYAAPHRVKTWCLGNEMDGRWQIGHMTAVEYGRKAADAARQMRTVDRGLELIACGSSSPGMVTYLEWDRQVLEECYNEVDAISLHRYYSNSDGNASRYLSLNLELERQIQEIIAVCDYVRGRVRSSKRLWLSFDEWNVWYRARGGDGKRQEAPRLLEEVYNLEDALLVGGTLNALLRQAERVRVACLAQIVNVIAPLMTSSTQVLRQSIYYPYAWALKYAKGRVLDLGVESETYTLPRAGGGPGGQGRAPEPVPYMDVAATMDAGECCVFVLNRDLEAEREVELVWHDATPAKVLACETLTGADLKAANSFEQPRRVVPQRLEAPRVGSRMTWKVPARSYSVLHAGLG